MSREISSRTEKEKEARGEKKNENERTRTRKNQRLFFVSSRLVPLDEEKSSKKSFFKCQNHRHRHLLDALTSGRDRCDTGEISRCTLLIKINRNEPMVVSALFAESRMLSWILPFSSLSLDHGRSYFETEPKSPSTRFEQRFLLGSTPLSDHIHRSDHLCVGIDQFAVLC